MKSLDILTYIGNLMHVQKTTLESMLKIVDNVKN